MPVPRIRTSAARYLGVSRQELGRWINQKEIAKQKLTVEQEYKLREVISLDLERIWLEEACREAFMKAEKTVSMVGEAAIGHLADWMAFFFTSAATLSRLGLLGLH